VIQLKKYIEPSNESDRIKAQQFLKNLNPFQRRRHLPQFFPVIDIQIEKFLDHIRREGIIEALKPYITYNEKKIQEEIEFLKCQLVNDTIISTQNSIFLYSMRDLVFHIEDNRLYVFLPEELWKFDRRENPYNRELLPDYLYKKEFQDYKTESIEETWTRILRRNLVF
jgi:hypothetical protein